MPSQELSEVVRSLARNLESIADLLDDIKTGVPALDAAMSDKKKQKRKARDPNMPKNPKSAYILFSMDKREEVKKEIGGDVREVMTELARRWQALSDKQKQPYIAEATKEKKRHEKEMEQYRAQKATEEGKHDDETTPDNEEEENELPSESSESSAEEAPTKTTQKKKPIVKPAEKPVAKSNTKKPVVKPAEKSEKPAAKSPTKPAIKKHKKPTIDEKPAKKARKNKQ